MNFANVARVSIPEGSVTQIEIGGTVVWKVPPAEYSITYQLYNCTMTQISSVLEGATFSGTVEPDRGYRVEDVTVTMGGVDITSSAYDPSDNTIYINNVNGDITIVASGYELPLYSVTYYLTRCTTSGEDSVYEGESFECDLIGTEGRLIHTKRITMGGSDITLSAYDDATDSISIDEVTGDIVIYATAAERYSVTYDLTNCTADTEDTWAWEDNMFYVNIYADDGYDIVDCVVYNGGVIDNHTVVDRNDGHWVIEITPRGSIRIVAECARIINVIFDLTNCYVTNDAGEYITSDTFIEGNEYFCEINAEPNHYIDTFDVYVGNTIDNSYIADEDSGFYTVNLTGVTEDVRIVAVASAHKTKVPLANLSKYFSVSHDWGKDERFEIKPGADPDSTISVGDYCSYSINWENATNADGDPNPDAGFWPREYNYFDSAEYYETAAPDSDTELRVNVRVDVQPDIPDDAYVTIDIEGVPMERYYAGKSGELDGDNFGSGDLTVCISVYDPTREGEYIEPGTSGQWSYGVNTSDNCIYADANNTGEPLTWSTITFTAATDLTGVVVSGDITTEKSWDIVSISTPYGSEEWSGTDTPSLNVGSMSAGETLSFTYSKDFSYDASNENVSIYISCDPIYE